LPFVKVLNSIWQAHLNGKRYKKAKLQEKVQAYDFSKYQPNIVQSKKDPSKLFCHLTKKTLNKVPEEIEIHVNGRRYKARLREREEKRERRAEKMARQGEKRAKAAAMAAAADGEDLDPALALAEFADDDDDDDEEEEGEEEEEEEEDEEEEGEEENSGLTDKVSDEDDDLDAEIVRYDLNEIFHFDQCYSLPPPLFLLHQISRCFYPTR
jgi:hypothetical protein